MDVPSSKIKVECSVCNHPFPIGMTVHAINKCPSCGNNSKFLVAMVNEDGKPDVLFSKPPEPKKPG